MTPLFITYGYISMNTFKHTYNIYSGKGENLFTNADYQTAEAAYKKTGSRDSWWRMWEIADYITRRLFTQELQKKGLKFPKEELEYKILSAEIYVLRRYTYIDNYHIQFIGAAMRFGMLHALYIPTPDETLSNNHEDSFYNLDTALLVADRYHVEDPETEEHKIIK